MNQINYEPGAIKISDSFLDGCLPDDIDLGAVQHRLTYEELRNFWQRVQTPLAFNFKLQSRLIVVILLSCVLFVVPFILGLQKSNPPVAGILLGIASIPMIISAVGLCINSAQIKKKVKQFIEKENPEIWNGKGLYWKFATYTHTRRRGGKTSTTSESFLELRLLASAMHYTAPGQLQHSFQGIMPNPYMQQPQVELSKYLFYSL